MSVNWWLNGVPQVVVNYHITAGTLTDDLDTPGEPLPEGPEEPTTDPIIEDDPSVQHEPVVED